MLVNVIPGKSYAVTAQADCAVTCEHQGRTYTLCAASSGAQAYFVSPIDTVTVSDDTALVTETFKSAALAVLGGGGTSEPEGDYVFYDTNNCVTGGRLNNMKDMRYFQKGRTGLKKWDIPLPNVTLAEHAFGGVNIEEWHISMPKLQIATSCFRDNNAMITFSGNFDSLVNADDFLWQCSNIENIEIDLPKLSTANDFCGEGKITKSSALRILNSIPSYTSGSHRLTLGIHIDHQADDEVLAAIEAAESKGWTLTLRWNGTATASAASTYGLRTPPIYARMVEKDGERILDWGHYVTDPTGYEEFRSVEAAREYFSIEE